MINENKRRAAIEARDANWNRIDREAADANRFAAALAELQRQIAEGREYPDAHASVAVKFKVDGDKLRDAYDLACMNVQPIN